MASLPAVGELVKALDERCVQEPSVMAVRRAQRACGRVPEPPNRGQLVVPVDRRDVCEETREAGRIVSVAAIVAVGVNTEGQRERCSA